MSGNLLQRSFALVLRSCGALLLVLALGACAAQGPRRPEALRYPPLEFAVPAVDSFLLDNGLRVYLREDNELPLVKITLMAGSGALAAPSGLAGFDGLFAATLRNGGTASRSSTAFEEELDRLAADLSCSMGPYTTDFNLSLRRIDLEHGFDLLADLLRHPAFAADQLELARSRALEALRRRNDDPDEIAARLLMAALYPGHPLGESPTAAGLARIDREQLVAFHRARFAPDNLWLAVSGDIRRDELTALLERFFADWPRSGQTARPLPPLEPAAQGLVQVVARDLPQSTILLGDLGLTKDDPDQYPARVLNFILGGGGFNSRLMREIRSDRGLAYSAWSQFQVGRRFPGPVMIGTETKNRSVVEALQLIRAIMAGLREQPVSDDELRVARDSLVNSFIFGFADSHAVVSQRMQYDFYGYPADYLERYRERIAVVTAADVQQVARRFLRPGRQQVIIVGAPEESGGGLNGEGLSVLRLTVEQLP